jgi:hypothetical protein
MQAGQSQPKRAIAPSLSSSLKLIKASGFLASACALAMSVALVLVLAIWEDLTQTSRACALIQNFSLGLFCPTPAARAGVTNPRTVMAIVGADRKSNKNLFIIVYGNLHPRSKPYDSID